MKVLLTFFVLFCSVALGFGQEQKAGNEASRNTEETFQKIIDQCDNTEILVLRAKIRLEISRATESAGKDAMGMLESAYKVCGEGQVEKAVEMAKNAYEIARQGVTDKFGQVGDNAVTEVQKNSEDKKVNTEEQKPWWKFW